MPPLPIIAQLYLVSFGVGFCFVVLGALMGGMRHGSSGHGHGGNIGHGHGGHAGLKLGGGHGPGAHGAAGGHGGVRVGGSHGHAAGAGHGAGPRTGAHTGPNTGSHAGSQGSHGTQGQLRGAAHEHPAPAVTDGNEKEMILLTLFNPTIIAAFLTWFGAAGALMWRWLPFPVEFTVLPAIVVSAVCTKFTVDMLGALASKMDQSVNFEESYLIGAIGEVSVSVNGTGLGEITYTVSGRRYNASARGTKPDLLLKRGSQVLIVDMIDDIFRVEPFEPVIDEGQDFDARLQVGESAPDKPTGT